MIGKVKWFSKEKGFGFIVSDEINRDIFVHIADIQDGLLIDGQHVEFELQDGAKGLKAKSVKVVPLTEMETEDND